MYLGFVLIRCGEANTPGDDCHEGGCFSSQLPRNRRRGAPCRATWGGTQAGQEEENLGKQGQKPICGFCEAGGTGWPGLGLASLNNFHGLWGGGGGCPRCLMSGPGWLGQRNIDLWCVKARWRRRLPYGLWVGWFTYQRCAPRQVVYCL